MAELHDERLYRYIVENAHEGIWIADQAGLTTYVNPRLARMLGYSPAEIIGRPIYHYIAPDLRAEVASEFEGHHNDVLHQRELRLLTSDGGEIWTLVNTSPLHGDGGVFVGRLAMVVDITARKAAEEVVRRSERRLQTIIDAEPACVKLVSPAGTLLDMNRAGLAMVGAGDLDQLVGRSVADLVHPADRDTFLTMHRAASEGSPQRGQFRMTSLQGGERWMDSHAVPFDTPAADGRSAVLSVTSDITDHKRLEEQLQQSQRLEAVGRLAGGIAHDFNNLLTAILGYCDLAETRLSRESPAQEDLNEIRSAGERAVALTQQLLAFSRKQVMNPRVLNLNDAIRSLVTLLPRVIGEDIVTSAVLDPQLRHVKVDQVQLDQVLLNLAVNARDAMPGGGSLRFATANVHLARAPVQQPCKFEPGPYVMLTVTDGGTGMDAETKARIFEPFFTTKETGSGLGLATVYGIVKQSHGFVLVDTKPGQGTTFTIYLPATSDAPETNVGREVDSSPARGHEVVLLVEDAHAVRHFARRALEAKGYRVVSASHAREALELAGQESDIDLLLTDVVMPGMRGTELATQLVRARPTMRVLYMSGYENATLPNDLHERPPSPLLRKPFTVARLEQAVREVLDATVR